MDSENAGLRKLHQQHAYSSLQMHEAIGRKAGLSGTDHKYLGFLIRQGSMTAGDLSKLTGLTTGAVTGLIDRFVKRQLVRRQYAETDRRKVIIVPDTQRITALLEPLYREYRLGFDALMDSFSSPERDIIEAYLSRALDLMNDVTAKIQGGQE